jgi:hypothetical protein
MRRFQRSGRASQRDQDKMRTSASAKLSLLKMKKLLNWLERMALAVNIEFKND